MALTVGWEEWVALPGLGIPAIRAKTDTGAQTSSLHAFAIHPVAPARGRAPARLRFGLHPLPERPEIEIYCEADLVEQRPVISSNGLAELRYIIATEIEIGGARWPIEISLTNRETMAYRMLLGRRTLESGVIVDVTRACVNGAPDLSVYDGLRKAPAAARPLSVAILASDPVDIAVTRLVETAMAHRHEVAVLPVSQCYIGIPRTGEPALYQAGRAVPRCDAVIPVLARRDTAHGLALLRQLERMGVRSLNSSTALAVAWDKLHMVQNLAWRGLAVPDTVLLDAPDSNSHAIRLAGGPPLTLRVLEDGEERSRVLVDTRKAAESVMTAMHDMRSLLLAQNFNDGNGHDAKSDRILCLIIGRRLVAALRFALDKKAEAGHAPRRVRLRKEERRLAKRALTAIGLKAAVVELLRSDDGPAVIDVAPAPSGNLDLFESTAGVDAAADMLTYLEGRAGRISRPPK